MVNKTNDEDNNDADSSSWSRDECAFNRYEKDFLLYHINIASHLHPWKYRGGQFQPQIFVNKLTNF